MASVLSAAVAASVLPIQPGDHAGQGQVCAEHCGQSQGSIKFVFRQHDAHSAHSISSVLCVCGERVCETQSLSAVHFLECATSFQFNVVSVCACVCAVLQVTHPPCIEYAIDTILAAAGKPA